MGVTPRSSLTASPALPALAADRATGLHGKVKSLDPLICGHVNHGSQRPIVGFPSTASPSLGKEPC